MSHVVTVQTKVRDPVAVAAACQRLGLAAPVEGTTRLYSGEASGLLVQLPGWQYPVVIDTSTGELRYDNYNGVWGEQQHLDHFLQLYAVEVVKLEARKKGYQVTEQTIRPLAIGRENWLHLGGDGALRPTAVLLSVAASVKRHGLDPWAYMKHVLTELPARPVGAKPYDLLPDRWARCPTGPVGAPG
jgi:hypothetical protein